MIRNLTHWWRETVAPRLATAMVGNAAWLGSATAINGVFGAIGSAIIARMLGVEDFGVLSLVLSLMTLLTEFSDLGLSSALTRYGSEALAKGDVAGFRSLASIVFRWRWALGAIIIFVSFLLLHPLLGSLFTEVDSRIEGYFKISLIGVVFVTIATSFIPVYQCFKAFRAQALLTIGRAGSKLVLILLFVYLLSYTSITWMIVAEIFSALVFLVAGYLYLPIRGFRLRTRDRQKEQTIVMFARWIALSQMFAYLATRIDLALIGALSDATGLGLYSAAQKVIGLMTVGVVSYSSILFVEMSSAPSQAALSMKRKEGMVIVVAMIVGIGLAALLANPLILILFGAKFAGAVPVFRIMCAGLACLVAAFPTNGTLFARNRSFAFPVMSGTSLAVLVSANVLLVPFYGPVGAAVAYAMGAAAALLVSLTLTLFARRNRREANG